MSKPIAIALAVVATCALLAGCSSADETSIAQEAAVTAETSPFDGRTKSGAFGVGIAWGGGCGDERQSAGSTVSGTIVGRGRFIDLKITRDRSSGQDSVVDSVFSMMGAADSAEMAFAVPMAPSTIAPTTDGWTGHIDTSWGRVFVQAGPSILTVSLSAEKRESSCGGVGFVATWRPDPTNARISVQWHWPSRGAGTIDATARAGDALGTVHGGELDGLELTKANPSGTSTASYPDAEAMCAGLDYAGQTDWRLPMDQEMRILAAAGARGVFENAFHDAGAKTYGGNYGGGPVLRPQIPRFWAAVFTDVEQRCARETVRSICREQHTNPAFCTDDVIDALGEPNRGAAWSLGLASRTPDALPDPMTVSHGLFGQETARYNTFCVRGRTPRSQWDYCGAPFAD